MIHKYKIYFLLFPIFLIMGCKSYGELTDKSITLKFPIKVDLQKIIFNKQLDSLSTDEYKVYRFKNIAEIKNDNLSIKGNFEVLLTVDFIWNKQIEDSIFLFNRIIITEIKGIPINEFIAQILRQNVTMYPVYQENGYYNFIDVDNKIRYNVGLNPPFVIHSIQNSFLKADRESLIEHINNLLSNQ